MTWHDMVQDGYWSVPFDGMFLGDIESGNVVYPQMKGQTIIVDSGTSYFLMPSGPFDSFR